MATSAATIAHLTDTLCALPLRFGKMFGEYAVYLDGKVVGFVCDDTFFLKITPASRALLPDGEEGEAYPGSKPYLILSEALDDPDFVARILRAVATDLPSPKPKQPKGK
ncbi:MAG: TfoX/Sxy family protein [Cypionkella sp.]